VSHSEGASTVVQALISWGIFQKDDQIQMRGRFCGARSVVGSAIGLGF